ncbi:hypothetical protein ACIBCT_34140 [Streptosporangium sp. NPDC050855]|uniref:hypothetical protein n=1 Tax=Streptosporangium sp. NPDC050855 TaxID=3366194 RepID=UPI0037AC04FA
MNAHPNEDDDVIMITVRRPTEEEMESYRFDDELALSGVRVEDADFSSRKIDNVSIGNGSTLVRCTFRDARIAGGCLGTGVRVSTYVECDFDGSSIRNVQSGRARFVSCSFRDVEIKDSFFLETAFVECVFSGTVEDSVFDADTWSRERKWFRRKKEPEVHEYRGNDFSGVRFRNVAFRGGVDLRLQTFPENGEHFVVRDALGVLDEAEAEVRSWPQGEHRSNAEVLLLTLRETAERRQKDLFVERSRVTNGLPKDLADRIERILRRH